MVPRSSLTLWLWNATLVTGIHAELTGTGLMAFGIHYRCRRLLSRGTPALTLSLTDGLRPA